MLRSDICYFFLPHVVLCFLYRLLFVNCFIKDAIDSDDDVHLHVLHVLTVYDAGVCSEQRDNATA